jgi:hypothetical protein
MESRDPKSTSVEELWSSLQELTEFDQAAESAARVGKLQEQREKIQRLDAYYDQTIAELRASLDGPPEGGI